MKNILILLLLCLTYSDAHSVVEITVTNNAELINAINQANKNGELHKITIDIEPMFSETPTLIISEDIPEITGFVQIIITKKTDVIPDENYMGPLFTVGEGIAIGLGGNVKIIGNNLLTIKNFHSEQNGGAIVVKKFAKFDVRSTFITDVKSDGNGGAIDCQSICTIFFTTFDGNSAKGNGGAVHGSGDAKLAFNYSVFIKNVADNEGSAIAIDGSGSLEINDSTIIDDNKSSLSTVSINGDITTSIVFSNFLIGEFFPQEYFSIFAQVGIRIEFTGNSIITEGISVDSPSGDITVTSSSFGGNSSTFNATGNVELFGNSMGSFWFNKAAGGACNDFGTNAFNSLGFNISPDTSCNLTDETDMITSVPIATIDNNGIPQLDATSPSVESGAVVMKNNRLPCPYKDLNGLGRPQDFDGDGVFTCDRGPVEIQSGADLTNAQSGLYYDVDRNGEGIIVEMLNSDSALVTMFTYHPNKTDLMWFIGVGNIVGNSIVLDNVQRTSGGVFGSSFNADDIVRTDVGGMSIVFPDCDSSTNPGRLTFQAGFEFSNELDNMLVKNQRLSRLLSCDQTQMNPLTGRSGSFYDPSRSGEGLFVEVLEGGTAVVIFYTYTPDGKQFWFISSGVTITGNTLTANMVFPASTTGFGSQFNPNEVDLQPWGTLTLEYQPGCSMVNVNYSSTVAGFGSGNLNYQRLTQPAGTTCDL